jgi:hypothetical protein
MHGSTARAPKPTALAELGTAPVEHGPDYQEKTIPCPECGGVGADLGSLNEPEACQVCCGAGVLLSPEEIQRIARKHMGRATEIERLEPGYFEERKWRVGE